MKRTEANSPDRRLSTDAPRWVKVFGIITVVLLVLFVVLHISGHGFGGHDMKNMPGTDMKGTDHMEHGAKPS